MYFLPDVDKFTGHEKILKRTVFGQLCSLVDQRIFLKSFVSPSRHSDTAVLDLPGQSVIRIPSFSLFEEISSLLSEAI